jgi:iron(II)-dependent oxidoreductase
MSAPEITELVTQLEQCRLVTLRLAQDLSDAELRTQFDPLFSPVGWHFGHIAWQEEVWVTRREGGRRIGDASYDEMFHPQRSLKDQRGLRLPPQRALVSYAANVRDATLEQLRRDPSPDLVRLARFVGNHERQHAEIMAIVRLLGELYLNRQGSADSKSTTRLSSTPPGAGDFVSVAGGPFILGDNHDPDGWDNERRAHQVILDDFRIGRYPVSSGEYLELIEAGGYHDERLWSAEGAAWRRSVDAWAPLHWQRTGDGWQRRSLWGVLPLDPGRPVSHVCYFEAQAFARFRGCRLPTEAEWERVASWDPIERRKRRYPWGDEAFGTPPANLDLRELDVAALGSLPGGASACGVEHLSGDVWEWTSDTFAPYPGFEPQAYEAYSAPWFDGRHRVARGGSFLTQLPIARCCFRNWYQPGIRQVPLGLRLAR